MLAVCHGGARITGVRWKLLGLLIMVCSLLATPCTGGEFRNFLSLQGFTGLLNTPNAEVTGEGKVSFLYSNQKENMWRSLKSREDSYIFSVGLFPFAEIGGRLTDAPPSPPDLSANFKVKAPFIPQGYYLPDIALGMQDVGGGSKKLQTKYLVATEAWWRFRFSLGYGAGPNRIDGVFGGVELKAFDWLYLLGENDTKETNVGIRLVTPEVAGFPLSVQLTAKTSLDYKAGNTEFGIGLQFPLGSDRHNRTPLPAKDDQDDEEKNTAGEKRSPAGATDLAASAVGAGTGGLGQATERGSLQSLREDLTAGGFQDVQVGTDAEASLLVVEFENSRYNHNELDGLGVAIGMIVDTVSPGFEIVQIVIKKKGIRVLQLSAPLSDFRAFLRDPDELARLNAGLEITAAVAVDEEVSFIPGYANPSGLKSELLLYPGLKTFVATEIANFDYLLSLKADYYLNLWPGAVVNARWDIPLHWSEHFQDGQAYRNSRNGNQMDRLMFFQALRLTPALMLNLGGGRVLQDTYGTIDELMWTPGGGNHRVMAKLAYAKSSDLLAQYPDNKAFLGAYRYYIAPLDLYLEATAGQFIDNDRGVTAELKRFFGDTAFSLFYKDSRTEAKEHVRMAGVQITLPLTPRRDMKPYALRVRGNSDWSYAQETKIVSPDAANVVSTSIGNEIKPLYNLEQVFYNRDRLSEEYIRKHLLRLRDAYLTYK